MAKHDFFFPYDEAGRVEKHDVFRTHISSVAPQFGLTPADVSDIEDDNDNLHWGVNWHLKATSEMVNLTEMKRTLLEGAEGTTITVVNFTVPGTPPATLKAGIFNRYRACAKQIKAHQNYTTQIGQLLGFIGAEVIVNPDQMKPSVSLKESLANKIIVNLLKGNYADGYAVYCHTFIAGTDVPQNPGDELTFDFLGHFITVPYIDYSLNQKKQPETRIYKFYYMKGDKIIGQASDLLNVICKVYMTADGAEFSGQVK